MKIFWRRGEALQRGKRTSPAPSTPADGPVAATRGRRGRHGAGGGAADRPVGVGRRVVVVGGGGVKAAVGGGVGVTLGVVVTVVVVGIVVVLAGLLLHLDVRGRGGGCNRIVLNIGTVQIFRVKIG